MPCACIEAYNKLVIYIVFTRHANKIDSKSYPTRRIPQILRRPNITCSGRWHMVWLISSSAHTKSSKNGLIRG